MSRTPISLGPDTTDVAVGSSTQGLGGHIASGFGFASSGTGVVEFIGTAVKGRAVGWGWVLWGVGVWIAVLIIGSMY